MCAEPKSIRTVRRYLQEGVSGCDFFLIPGVKRKWGGCGSNIAHLLPWRPPDEMDDPDLAARGQKRYTSEGSNRGVEVRARDQICPLTPANNGLQRVYLTRVGPGLELVLFGLIGSEVSRVSDVGYKTSRIDGIRRHPNETLRLVSAELRTPSSQKRQLFGKLNAVNYAPR